MSTSTTMNPSAAAATHSYDRVFYSGMAVTMALVVFVGFAPTYYLRLFSIGTAATISGSPFTRLLHLHGALFTAWVLLFIIQTALVAKHRVKLHQRLGMAGAVLAALMVIAGVSTAIAAAKKTGAAPPDVDPLVFLVIPLADMTLFTFFMCAALWFRRQKEMHKRLMLLAYISILTAGVARLPGVLPLGPLVFFGLTFLFIVAAMFYDAVTRRRVHAVYIWGGTLLVVSVPARLWLSGTELWRAFAEFATR